MTAASMTTLRRGASLGGGPALGAALTALAGAVTGAVVLACGGPPSAELDIGGGALADSLGARKGAMGNTPGGTLGSLRAGSGSTAACIPGGGTGGGGAGSALAPASASSDGTAVAAAAVMVGAVAPLDGPVVTGWTGDAPVGALGRTGGGGFGGLG